MCTILKIFPIAKILSWVCRSEYPASRRMAQIEVLACASGVLRNYDGMAAFNTPGAGSPIRRAMRVSEVRRRAMRTGSTKRSTVFTNSEKVAKPFNNKKTRGIYRDRFFLFEDRGVAMGAQEFTLRNISLTDISPKCLLKYEPRFPFCNLHHFRFSKILPPYYHLPI